MDDFLDDEDGQMLLDSICMLLIAVGESVKQIDKITDNSLLIQYPSVPWKKVAGIRDILSHHYFDLNAEVVYGLCQDHIKDLNNTLQQIHNDLKSSKK
ncbi:HepT-like ribonuclease domain-containing protein [Sulfurovum sp.]|uniref:HepT-like ribonuclease domain-containing protein n=1 Tax=Sulfurovum sp. TaxID=1969726 RepID=UPI0025DFFCE0|nr:HepT-like ribonuclease domain-containing protein [Sulfurovum sp.]